MKLCSIVFRVLIIGAATFASATHGAIINVGTPVIDDASLPSYLTDGSYLFGATVSLAADQFLLPIEIKNAIDLQTWQFDLFFDPSVVEVIDPGDGTAGLYGAQFSPDDANSLSFILGGFASNSLGIIDDVAGSYPILLNGASGDGVLAYVLFHRLGAGDPGFGVESPPIVSVAEPNTLILLAGVLLFYFFLTHQHRQHHEARSG